MNARVEVAIDRFGDKIELVVYIPNVGASADDLYFVPTSEVRAGPSDSAHIAGNIAADGSCQGCRSKGVACQVAMGLSLGIHFEGILA